MLLRVHRKPWFFYPLISILDHRSLSFQWALLSLFPQWIIDEMKRKDDELLRVKPSLKSRPDLVCALTGRRQAGSLLITVLHQNSARRSSFSSRSGYMAHVSQTSNWQFSEKGKLMVQRPTFEWKLFPTISLKTLLQKNLLQQGRKFIHFGRSDLTCEKCDFINTEGHNVTVIPSLFYCLWMTNKWTSQNVDYFTRPRCASVGKKQTNPLTF